jgi:signal transduction histidine kinase
MRSLVNRLTAWYAVVFVGLLVLVVVVSSLTLVSMLRHEMSVMLRARTSEVHLLGKALGSNEAALRVVAPAIADDMQNFGVRGAVFDNEGRLLAGDQSLADDGARFVAIKNGQMSPPERGALRYIPYPGGYLVVQPAFDFLLFNLGPYWLTLGMVLVVTLVIAWFAGRVLAKQALAPIVEVTNAMDSLGKGDFSRRALVRGEPNEINALAAAYNSAAEKVGAAFAERRQTEERMRQFSADAGHELRTPLTVISGYVSVLRRGAVTEPAVAGDILSTIADECERMRHLIDKLLALARLDSMPQDPPELVDAARVVRDAAVGSHTIIPGAELRVDTPEPLQVRAYPDELRDAVRNLIENAAKHGHAANVTVSAHRENGMATIEVSDDGAGMPPDEQAHAFERFFRGALRGDTAGSGLGLAIVRKAVERVGGSAQLRSEQGKGTTVTLKIPIAHES